LKHFPDVIEEHLASKTCTAGVCFTRRGSA